MRNIESERQMLDRIGQAMSVPTTGRATSARITSSDDLGGMLHAAARSVPDRVAVKEFRGRARTYRDLDLRSNRMANALLANGLHPGDRIGVWMGDRIELVELCFAAAKAGLVLVPISHRFDARRVADVLHEIRPRVVVYDSSVSETVTVPDVTVHGATMIRLDELDALTAQAPAAPFPAAADDAVFLIAQSSGTSGKEKSVMLTQRAVKAAARSNALAYRLALGSIGIASGSLAFAARIPALVMSHVYVSGTVVLGGEIDAETQVAAIEEEQGTYTSLSAAQVLPFIEVVERDPHRIASLQSVLHSSTKVPDDDLRRLAKVVGDRLVEGWGVTENCGALITATTKADVDPALPGTRYGTIGRATPETVVEIVDEDGRPLPHDGMAVGELVVRGPSMMAGYWKNPKKSAVALRGGWLWTGDLGAIDHRGAVRLVERKVDVVYSDGEAVYPSEVEARLRRHDVVEDCAVVDDDDGALVAVVVVARGAASVGLESALLHWCRDGLPASAVPHQVTLLPSLPKGHNGAVRRAATRDILGGRRSATADLAARR